MINPATEQVARRMSMGEAEDVNRAVAAARRAFQSYSRSSRESRTKLLQRIAAGYEARKADLTAALTEEIGVPAWLAEQAHVPLPMTHINVAIELLQSYPLESSTA